MQYGLLFLMRCVGSMQLHRKVASIVSLRNVACSLLVIEFVGAIILQAYSLCQSLSHLHFVKSLQSDASARCSIVS